MKEIQAADPVARRKAVWIILGATLLGSCAIIAIQYFQDEITAWLERHLDFILKYPVVVFAVSLIFFLPVLAGIVYLYRLGARTVHTQRFPPPGYAVSRDTPILKADQAIIRGRLIQVFSLLLIGVIIAISLFLWYLFYRLGLSYQGIPISLSK